MKLFISQPMSDKTNEQIVEERNNAIKEVKFNFSNIEVIDTFFKDVPHNAKPLWYLGEAIKLLSEADIVYFCNDWQHYRGCVIEHECAVRYGKEIIYA